MPIDPKKIAEWSDTLRSVDQMAFDETVASRLELARIAVPALLAEREDVLRYLRDNIWSAAPDLMAAAVKTVEALGNADDNIGRLRADLEELLDVMLEVEWGECSDGEGIGPCPVCGRFRRDGHAPDCRIAAFLGKP